MTDDVRNRIKDAYARMARLALYRPSAEGDVLGQIPYPEEELVLEDEAREYAERWLEEERTGSFYVGTTDYETLPATIFAVEAARLLCRGLHQEAALRLLLLAKNDLEGR
jgi:hypothetical protein